MALQILERSERALADSTSARSLMGWDLDVADLVVSEGCLNGNVSRITSVTK